MRAGLLSERALVGLVGAVQFVNILDFMMVMPLGPDFARELGIPSSDLGIIGGAYTAAAAVSGVAGAGILDRFDRRKALAVSLFGLVLGTLAGAFATGLPSLVAARVVAGLFGGPATSVSLSIIADAIPPERRGRAMGAIMGAFSASSVIGVPLGLEIAAWGGWRAPFYAVAGLGAVVSAAAIFILPPMTGHLVSGPQGALHPHVVDLFRRREVLASYAMTLLAMGAGFALIPNFSAYIQDNLHWPRERLSWLYMAGGVVSFFATRYAGRVVDRVGSFRVALVATGCLVAVTYCGFALEPPPLPVLAIFVGFMLAMSVRNVAYQTLTSKVPLPAERAGYMSIQSAVQHLGSALGAMASAKALSTRPDGALEGMARVALVSIALVVLIPALFFLVERWVAARDAARLSPP